MKFRIAFLFSLVGAAVVAVNGQPNTVTSFGSITKAEIEMLLADVGSTNPATLKLLAEDPAMRKRQIENLKQLLAFASQAQRDGLASEPTNRQELASIRAETLAVIYDREANKGRDTTTPFAFITDAQVAAYWSGGQPGREAEFKEFLDAKIALFGASNPEMKERDITAEEKTQARETFAKIRIYAAAYEQMAKAGKLSKSFTDKANLQVKLQQAQFLARIFSEKHAERMVVTDEEIAKYIAERPELDPAANRAMAEKILKRAKAGEDFAALANEFSEDPGNVNAEGKPQGGIYTDVPEGRMVPPFERAALALEPGQIALDVVETDFGYHIIKLEKKGMGKDDSGRPVQTYDVRHILVSTMYKNPADPDARDIPVKDYVRDKLETEKEKAFAEKIIAENNIQVPEDFAIPEITGQQTPKAQKAAPARKKRPIKKRR